MASLEKKDHWAVFYSKQNSSKTLMGQDSVDTAIYREQNFTVLLPMTHNPIVIEVGGKK
jgi:hypothetical protein